MNLIRSSLVVSNTFSPVHTFLFPPKTASSAHLILVFIELSRDAPSSLLSSTITRYLSYIFWPTRQNSRFWHGGSYHVRYFGLSSTRNGCRNTALDHAAPLKYILQSQSRKETDQYNMRHSLRKFSIHSSSTGPCRVVMCLLHSVVSSSSKGIPGMSTIASS
jgi:hypothetical protein